MIHLLFGSLLIWHDSACILHLVGALILWDERQAGSATELSMLDNEITGVAFSRQDNPCTIVATCDNGGMYIFDIRKSSQVMSSNLTGFDLHCVVSDGSHAIAGTGDGCLCLMDLAGDMRCTTLPCTSLSPNPVACIEVTHDHGGMRVVTGSSDGTVSWWSNINV